MKKTEPISMQGEAASSGHRITVMSWFMGWLCLMSFSAQAYDYSLLPPMNGLPSDFAERRAGAEVKASIRMGVTNDGIYRVSYSALTNAGVSATDLIGSMMRLFCRTQEIAILVSSSNHWTANDYLLFPGTGFDGYYSMTNIYWLGFGPGGKRIASRSAIPIGGAPTVTSYRKTALHHVDNDFRESYRGNDETIDHWIDLYLSDTVPQDVSLATDRVITNTPAQFDAVMLGFTSVDAIAPDHCTAVSIASTPIGRFLYDGQSTAIISTSFPASLLSATNTIRFQQIRTNGVLGDAAYLERCSVTYSRTLYQEKNALLFNGTSGINNYLVTGFGGSNGFSAFDITDPANAVGLTGLQTTNMGGGIYAVKFGDTASPATRYAVCQTAGFSNVSMVQRTFFRDLASTNQLSDYIVICPYDFRQQVYRLLTRRYTQGLSVEVAPLPDIYNQFSYGIADAAAIKQFIGYAFHHRKTPPKYVLLVGSGTYDPRNNENSVAPDIIPVHLGGGYNEWTALDGWYATVQNKDEVTDYIPDVVIGRIPVETTNQLRNVIDKIIAFETMPSNHWWRTSALLVSDNNEPDLDFTGASDYVKTRQLDPNAFYVDQVDHRFPEWNSGTIITDINTGEFLVNYFGHGASQQWADKPVLFSSNNIPSLTNSLFPVITMMTCKNGAFYGTQPTHADHQKAKCLAELFLEPANRGAVICTAASGLSTLPGSKAFVDGLYNAIITQKMKRIGDAMLPAYQALYLGSGNTTELLYFELFGDPATIVNP